MGYSVTYDGNSNTSGTAPSDNNSYSAGDTVTVQPGGSLAKSGATFAYWNTEADGSGSIYGFPGPTTFPMPGNDATLYAQWYITTGLNTGQNNGPDTTHYKFAYDASLQQTTANPSGIEPARTNQVIAAAEGDYAQMFQWFGKTVNLSGPVTLYVTRLGGGAITSPGSLTSWLKPETGDASVLRYLIVSEVTELFMMAQNKGWSGGGDESFRGEGLSRFLAQQGLVLNNLGIFEPGYELSYHWFNSSLSGSNSKRYQDSTIPDPADSTKSLAITIDYGSRLDYLNYRQGVPYTETVSGNTGQHAIEGDNGILPDTGCSMLFLYYLQVQLGFSITSIVTNAPLNGNNAGQSNPTLRMVYNNLTNDAGDPFPQLNALLSNAYPPSQIFNSPTDNPDNPFPVAIVIFLEGKNTFGKDETQDIINNQGGVVSNAFWLAVDGFNKQGFQSLNVQAGAFAGSFANLPGVKISPNPAGAQFQSGINDFTPQEIRIPFDITLSSSILGQFPATDSSIFDLSVSLVSGGNTITGSQASTDYELLAGADPYFYNIDPNQANKSYLSQDLRVFTTTPGRNASPISGIPQPAQDSVSGAFAYIQNVLSYFNTNFSDPNGEDPFNTKLPDQFGDGQNDSSVNPLTYDFSNPFVPRIYNNYNFAIARVRLQGSSGATGEASNVRVFFRLFSTVSNDTDFDPNGTYLSTNDSNGHPVSPQLGSGNSTIPFFATGNLLSNTDYSSGGPNVQTLEIPQNRDSLWWYFGCFINLYDTNNTINNQQIQTYLNGTHHCIVAQIAYDDAPIPMGASPLSWDQLAQRNLQITVSDNPGPAATHRIPQTFDCRPSLSSGSGSAELPDELMIDWGAVPAGAVASIYWPAAQSATVIALAQSIYGATPLMAADSNTISVPITGGLTYIPIPPGSGQNFAGLLTVDLPSGITQGQQFNIVVRRVSTHASKAVRIADPAVATMRVVPADDGSGAAQGAQVAVAVAAPPAARFWRYVVGSFQIQIPVTTGDQILPAEQGTLAIMKWRLAQMSPSNRWYPVLQRYIAYCSARVDGLGGDASKVPASLTGYTPGHEKSCDDEIFTGKISEVYFDCHGDFTGFALEDCCSRRQFDSRRRGIGRLALRACKEELRVSVKADASRPEVILSLTIHR